MFDKLPVAFYQLAMAQLANNETDKAVANLNQALTLNPKYARRHSVAGRNSNPERKCRARDCLPETAGCNCSRPSCPPDCCWRTLIAIQGNLDSAAQIYRGLEKAYPTNAQLPLLLGTTLLQQKDNAGARAEFDQALKLAPDYLPALEQVVNLDLVEKQYAAAQQRVQQQIGHNPKSAELQLLLANVLVARGDTNQAETTLQKAIELEPDSQAGVFDAGPTLHRRESKPEGPGRPPGGAG